MVMAAGIHKSPLRPPWRSEDFGRSHVRLDAGASGRGNGQILALRLVDLKRLGDVRSRRAMDNVKAADTVSAPAIGQDATWPVPLFHALLGKSP
jgi:hypothetical protein